MKYSRPWMFLGLSLMAVGGIMLFQQGCQPQADPPVAKAPESKPAKPAADAPKGTARGARGTEEVVDKTPLIRQDSPRQTPPSPSVVPPKWIDLFDGKTLDGWKAPKFGGEGEVSVQDGQIVMGMGSNMTGVTWTGKVLRNNYELALEGMRIDGSDFFCAMMFPVGDDPCTLVVGGWGGAVVGLSSIDSKDASENATTKIIGFKRKQWYRVRIRVSDAAIEAWIDDEQVVNQPRKGHKIDIRNEVKLCCPLGISTWCTTGAVRNIRVRPLDAGK